VSQQINLCNPDFIKKDKPFSLRTMSQALGLIALGVIGLYVYAALHTRATERLASDLSARLTSQREQVEKLAKVPARVASKALEAEVARLDGEVKSRQTTLRAVSTGELGNTAGFSDFFAALGRRAIPGVWLTSVTIGDSGNELVVQGRALRADLMPAFLRALNDEPVMRGRNVTEMKLTAKAPAKGADTKAGVQDTDPFIEFSLTAPLQVAEAAPADAVGKP
jgi:Tfp pilus assembly protein PilN